MLSIWCSIEIRCIAVQYYKYSSIGQLYLKCVSNPGDAYVFGELDMNALSIVAPGDTQTASPAVLSTAAGCFFFCLAALHSLTGNEAFNAFSSRNPVGIWHGRRQERTITVGRIS